MDPRFDALLCDPADKAQLETNNALEQLNYVEHLILDQQVEAIRESHVLQLHELAVQGIFGCGGKYRSATKEVTISNSRHTLPDAAMVKTYVVDALGVINDFLERAQSPEACTYALWRFNWIHPFAGGNGRTARMITLLALAIRLRAMPPGVPTFPTRIEREREAYLLGLNRADHGAMDFLQAFVTTLVLEMFGNNATDLRAYLTDLQAFATRARILGII